MKKTFTLFIIALFAGSILSAQTYQAAESVEYDPVNNRWLVSNGDRIIADDGAGNLSYFGTGGATHGMEVLGNVLYAVDGGAIRAYDLEGEFLLGFVNIPGAQFLNGLTNDGTGNNLYVTDFGAKKIHKINAADFNNLTSEEIVSNTQGTPNGIVYDGENNRLLYGTWGSNAAIKAVDLSDNSVSTIVTTSLGSLDGIDEDNEGSYYISTWSPAQISKFDKDFANPLEVISTPFINNPADIGYSLQTDTLAIPIGGDVVFVGFETEDSTTAITNLSAADLGFKIFPNPVSDQSYIQFELEQNESLKLQILDQQGRVIHTLLKGQQSQGIHKVLFVGHDLPSGIYYCRLEIGAGQVVKEVLLVK